jgi:hypothetical protein
MAQDVFINITDLPQATEARAGDYFIIETSTGTQIINFSDIIIPIDNTLITPLVTTNKSNIDSLTLSATDLYTHIGSTNSELSSLKSDLLSLQSQTGSLPTKTDTDTITASISDLVTKTNQLEASLDNKIFKSIQSISILQNARTTSLLLDVPETLDIQIEDIIIIPKNNYSVENTKSISVTKAEIINPTTNQYKVDIEASFRKPKLKVDQTILADAITSLNGNTSLSTMNINTLFTNVLSKYIEALVQDTTEYSAEQEATYTILVLKDY